MPARLPAIVLAVATLIGALSPAAASQEAPPAGGEARPVDPAAQMAEADAQAAEAIALMARAVDDRAAKTVMEQLKRYEELWKRVSPKMLKKLTTSVVAMFKGFEPRDDYDLQLEPTRAGDEPRVWSDDARRELLECYRLAVGVLYDKPEGRATLESILKIPHVRAWPDIVAIIVEGLGYHQPDESLIALVKPYLGDPSPVIAGAAAKALSQLHDAPIAVRRKAVGVLVGAYSEAQDAADKERRRAKPQADDEEQEGESGEVQTFPAAERLMLLDVPFGMALAKLTRQNFPDAAGWQAWFDAHGKETTW